MLKIEDGAPALQVLSFNRKANSSIALHASDFRANFVVVLKDAGILILFIYSHSACAISKERVTKTWQK